LFSTGFFKFTDDGKLSASDMIWIYPAVVIPLTATVFGIWYFWRRLRPNKALEEVKKLGLSIERRNTKLEQNENLAPLTTNLS
jgi:hypothetical protein